MTDSARRPSLLTTRQVASRLDVSEATVKRWSDSGALACERTPGGHRKFRADEVERLALRLHGVAPPASVPSMDVDEICRHALAGDAVSLHVVAERWMNGGGRLDSLFDLVFRPALEQVGERWAAGTATVADEHTASAAMAEVVNRLAGFVTQRPRRGTAISACLAGEHHGLASRMCGLLLREAGFHALVPGPDTPDDALLALIEESDARVVCLSASCLLSGDASLVDRVESVRALLAPRGARLFLGGDGFAPPGFEPLPPARFLADMRALSTALRRPAA